jgi:hypothetical protein
VRQANWTAQSGISNGLGTDSVNQGDDAKLFRNLAILLGLSVTFLAAVLAFHASSHVPTQLIMSKP